MVALLAKNYHADNKKFRYIFRCIREMLVCIEKIRVIREIRGLKKVVMNDEH